MKGIDIMVRKHRIKKLVKKLLYIIAAIALSFALFLSLGTTLPYISHKKASEEIIEAFDERSFYGNKKSTERIRHITDNKEALIARLALINSAKHEIVLTTFEFFDDESGQDILSALSEAAERGVKIRMLVDAYKGNELKNSRFARYLASLENTEVKLYNPLKALKPWKAQSRMHEKYIIADRQIYLLGGRNTNNRFLGEYGDKYLSSDRELLVYTNTPDETSSVAALYKYFEEYFSHEDCVTLNYHDTSCESEIKSRCETLKKLYPEAYTEIDLNELTIPVNKISLVSGQTVTGNKSPDVWYQLIELMKTGNNIIIQTPYIMCGKEMYSDLASLSEGRSVSLLINSPFTGSNTFGNADYLNEREKIYSLGMRVYEHTGDVSHHTKTIVIDDRLSIIGSFNFDMRSAYIDSELMLVIDSPELNRELRDELGKYMDSSRMILPDGTVVRYEGYEEINPSLPAKLKSYALRAFIPFIRHLI